MRVGQRVFYFTLISMDFTGRGAVDRLLPGVVVENHTGLIVTGLARSLLGPEPKSETRMAERYFTVDEANRTLPLVKRIVRDIVYDYARWKEAVRQYEVLTASAEGEESAEQISRRLEVERLAERIEGYVEELTVIGCVFKGFDEGLVDFYGKRNGQDVFWCWKLGEPAVEYWHEIDAGFAGRQPLVGESIAGESG